MTDINVVERDERPEPAGAEPDRMLELIELLFFAYRDFISDPDQILADYGFGRAHHRVLHFVNRHPGLRVADLLDILKITKQSLGRVLKQLVDCGFVEQRTGPRDRRQRLLFTTDKGRALAEQLTRPQSRRIRAALEAVGLDSRQIVSEFLFGVIDPLERERAARLIDPDRAPR